MTRNKRIARVIWWGLLVLWILCMGAGIYLFCFGGTDNNIILEGTPLSITSYLYYALELIDDSALVIWIISVFYIGLFFFTQLLFLSSKKHWKIKTQTTGRPMKKAAIGVTFPVSLLSVGLVYSLFDLLWKELFSGNSPSLYKFILLSIPLLFWILWSIVFSLYFYQSDYLKWSGRIVKGLIGGSILELFISIPIFVTREDECYCATGSYAGLVFGVTVLLWAFGPGIFLLYWREKKRVENSVSNNNE